MSKHWSRVGRPSFCGEFLSISKDAPLMTKLSTPVPTELVPAESELSAPKSIAAGCLPPWKVGELPTPPRLTWNARSMIGPGLLMAGAAIGGGEWLMGPAVTARYGGAIMWLATISIVTQVVYNLEVMRYALYCGEPIFVGFFRMLPGPRFWAAFYLFIDFFGLWPYLAANAAIPLSAAVFGHLPGVPPTQYQTNAEVIAWAGISEAEAERIRTDPKHFGTEAGQVPYPAPIAERMKHEQSISRWIAYGIFVVSFIPLVFGGKIYNALLRIMVVKIVLVLGYLLVLAWMLVSWETTLEVFAGFAFLSKSSGGSWGFGLPPIGSGGPIDWALLGAFAAVAGQGGMNNAQFSSYVRDRGWGMGSHVGAIPSLVGGEGVTLSHDGVVFEVNKTSMSKWRGWLRVVYRDQWAIWLVGCILGMAIPSLISLQLLRGQSVSGNAVAAATAQAVSDQTGSAVFWSLTLLCGFLVLAPNQISATDGLLRRWTDVLWAGHPKLRNLPHDRVRFVYFTLLALYFVWGLVILVWIGDQPMLLMKASGVIMNFILGFSALHTLAVNLILLPAPLRPGWISRIGLLACAAFFIAIAALGTPSVWAEIMKSLGVNP